MRRLPPKKNTRKKPPPRRAQPRPARKSEAPTKCAAEPLRSAPGDYAHWEAVADEAIDPYAWRLRDRADDPPQAYAGLVGEVMEAIERLEADPVAQRAVHNLRFAAVTVQRSGAELAGQLRQGLDLGFQTDWKLRPWLRNMVRVADELLKE